MLQVTIQDCTGSETVTMFQVRAWCLLDKAGHRDGRAVQTLVSPVSAKALKNEMGAHTCA